MILHLLIYAGASERKGEQGQTRFSGWTDERGPTFGARHNTVSLLCQTGLDRRTGDIGWGNEIFFFARKSMLPRDRVYRDRSPRDPRVIRAAFTASRSPTDDDKFGG